MSAINIFKFGGASVHDAAAIQNVAAILRAHQEKPLVVVISAMGKMTNAFEALISSYHEGKKLQMEEHLHSIISYHQAITTSLFTPDATIFAETEALYAELRAALNNLPSDFDYDYDRLVCFGERLSTTIIAAYLNSTGLSTQLLDARKLFITDHRHREALINWQATATAISAAIPSHKPGNIMLTQGFIGGTLSGETTTLGREGSDFTAAIIAWCLDAQSMTIWKDVDGLLNADPTMMPEARLLENISYHEAIELSYYGAKVIHPKTIKPLQNKNIPLQVKSFLNPNAKGSLINHQGNMDKNIPSYIFKEDQILLSISSNDFSFVTESGMQEIFGLFAQYRTRVNLMQNSAISFSVCIDHKPRRFPLLLKELQKRYGVKYNRNLTLVTVRHYHDSDLEHISQGRHILLEQKNRTTAQLILGKKS